MGGLSIVLASNDDVDRVLELVAACIADMRAAGIEQWDEVYPDRQTLLKDAHDRTLYLASFDREPLVGTLVVNTLQSPEYSDVPWTMTGEHIAVVHRLMIDPRYQRRGIARADAICGRAGPSARLRLRSTRCILVESARVAALPATRVPRRRNR